MDQHGGRVGPHELTEDDRTLLEAAHEAAKHAYAPYSGFHVGAPCAWRAAQLSRAATKKTWPTLLGCAENVWPCSRQGRNTLAPRMTAVAIVSPSEKAIPEGFMPCGGCRQVLVEAERRQDQHLSILLQVRTKT